MSDNKPDISILIVVHNEEEDLEDCLASAAVGRECVVVLDRCTDRSGEIARRFQARTLEGAWPVEADRRNAGIEFCRSGWILELDADERISDALGRELAAAASGSVLDYYYVPLHNYIGGYWVRHGWGAYNGAAAKTALFRKGCKVWGAGEIHPKIALSGKSGWMTGHIDHFVDKDVASLIARLNRYSDAAARDLARSGQPLSVPRTMRRFFSRAFKSYWQRRGYREGWRGVLLALFSGLYPVLAHIKALDLRERARRDV